MVEGLSLAEVASLRCIVGLVRRLPEHVDTTLVRAPLIDGDAARYGVAEGGRVFG